MLNRSLYKIDVVEFSDLLSRDRQKLGHWANFFGPDVPQRLGKKYHRPSPGPANRDPGQNSSPGEDSGRGENSGPGEDSGPGENFGSGKKLIKPKIMARSKILAKAKN